MIRVVSVIFCVFFLIIGNSAEYAKTPPAYAVASANPMATNAGLYILSQGGNAFDAAVAVSAVLAVVEPYHSGLGGGGFWLLHDAKTNKNTFLDGREVAPGLATKDMFLDKNKNPIAGKSLNGGLAAAIPGEPAALVMLSEHYGRLPLSKSLSPAILLADNGFDVDNLMSFFLNMDDRAAQLEKYPASKAIFAPNGKPLAVGSRLVQHDLANTLRMLAEKGRDGFYRGEIAMKLVQSVNQAGGIWTLDDLANYQVKLRKPIEGNFHDMHIVTVPMPSAGGVALITMLNILESYPLSSLNKLMMVHYIVESMRMAYWQRSNFLGDSDFVRVPLNRLLSRENADYLRSFIQENKATDSSSLPEKSVSDANKQNTTHFSIIDREGNRVAATLSINYYFGSSVVAAGTGVLMNDHMDDFSIKTDAANVFGLHGSEQNSIAPGKRPLSSMTPTFLEMPGRLAVLGTPGGSRIPTMVLLSSILFSQEHGAITMASAMRFHHQYLPDKLQFEPSTFSLEQQDILRKMGYTLDPLPAYYGDMQVVTWDRVSNLVTATADPRRIGLGAVGVVD